MMATLAKFSCSHCGAVGERHAGRVERYKREGKAIYCSKVCQCRAFAAANPERIKKTANARYRRPEVRDAIRIAQRQAYEFRRDTLLARCKEYREANPEKVRSAKRRWLIEHPDRAEIYSAKSNLARTIGVRWSEIPEDLAEAKAEQIKIMRWVRESRAKER